MTPTLTVYRTLGRKVTRTVHQLAREEQQRGKWEPRWALTTCGRAYRTDHLAPVLARVATTIHRPITCGGCQ